MPARTHRVSLTLALVSVLTVALVACGGVELPGKASDPGRAAAPAQVTDVSTGAPAAAPETSQPAAASVAAPAPDTTLADADAIVAAHEQVLGDIYEAVLPSVVRIEVAQRVGPRSSDEFIQQGEGSGFVWSAEGHIVTNHHVIAEADRVTVVFADGSEYEADVLGSDAASDLAVLKMRSVDGPLTPAGLGDSGSLRVGQLAVAIGAPFGQSFTMTRGIVSALGRLIDGATGGYQNPQIIQTDAPINPGNSGGPLLDRRGNVIGINSQIVSRSGSSAGVGFAVPINTARLIVPELIETGAFEYPYLGISGVTLRPRINDAGGLPGGTRGVLVAEVIEDGPAAVAGLDGGDEVVTLDGAPVPIGGDVITAIDGASVETMPDLIAYLVENSRPGDTVTLEVLRGGGGLADVEVTLTARPDVATSRPS